MYRLASDIWKKQKWLHDKFLGVGREGKAVQIMHICLFILLSLSPCPEGGGVGEAAWSPLYNARHRDQTRCYCHTSQSASIVTARVGLKYFAARQF